MFLTERSSRHAILRKERRAREEGKGGVGVAGGGKMTGESKDEPVDVDGGEDDDVAPAPVGLRREDSEKEADDGAVALADIPPAPGEHPQQEVVAANDDDKEDKKKLALNTRYEGFSIYNRILCLVVKRKGAATSTKGKEPQGGAGAGPARPMMEEWISSTQMGEGGGMDD